MKAILKAVVPAPVRRGLRRAQGHFHDRLRPALLHSWRSAGRAAERAIGWAIVDRAEVWLGRRDPLIPPARLREYVGHGGYVQIGQEFLHHFIELGGLQPTDRVLDVGCGIGRMAAPLARYLTTGGYDGFDIVPTGIEWCTRHITPRHPNFRFHLADVYNPAYYTEGRHPADGYRFPFADACFDFTFLVSVFTHLRRPAMANYLREVTRVLRPGGRCFITYLLLNEPSLRCLQEGKCSLPFYASEDGTMLNRPDIPEAIIAHQESTVRALYAACGLLLHEPIRYGTWCGREQGLSFQDIVIATKPE